MNTLYLDPGSWDLVADASGNIAMATEPYSQAQDAASAIRLFAHELFYDTTQGILYFQTILGEVPSFTFLKTQFNNAALTVPGVVTAQTFFSSFIERVLTGQVQITNTAGQTAVATFSVTLPNPLPFGP